MLASLLLGLAFLFLLCVLAVVSLRMFGARDAEGRRSAPGCLGGCAMTVVLALLGFVGLGVFIAALAVSAPSEEFRDSLHEAAREVSSAVREQAQELRRELQDEFGDERPTRVRRTTASDPAPTASEVPAPWRARVVLSWPGESDPPLALVEALAAAGLQAPIDIALTSGSDESGGQRTKATMTAAASAASAAELRRTIDAAVEHLRAESGLELTVLEVLDEDLR